MVKNTKLNFLTCMISSVNGKPLLNLSQELVNKLNIKTNDDIEDYRDQIPNYTFADVLNELFDSVPFSSNKHFSLYNNILIDIRIAKRANQIYINTEKSELETLKDIFEKAIINKPEINRKSAFIMEVIDQCIADIINENNPEKVIVESTTEN